jgi:4a-hydroxytetrahydrobiopterin dehydratase
MATVLTDEELQATLTGLPGWAGDSKGIARTVTAPTFLAGIALVDAVAQVAEAVDHHPDIDIRWRTLTFRLSTHSAGGVTELDLDLARRIDTLIDDTLGG